jgi:Dolichyl-phosphate-mannose-protein mannosyltransferase
VRLSVFVRARMRGVAPIAAVLLFAGGLVVFLLERKGGHEPAALGLWIALHVIAIVAAVLETPRRAPAGPRAHLKTIALAAAVAGFAALAVGWNLAGVPRNVHNDVGSTVEAARAFVEGRRGIFEPGYAEVPGPGSLPTALSLKLLGNTMIGGRAGAAALGILAVLGVFALGRELRNERTGFFAGILLAGSIPFVHYSRLTPFGEVTAWSVWLLWAILRAERADRPTPWLAAGVLGGWGLMLFYSARVSLLGAIAGATLLLARPLRRAPRRLAFLALFAIGAGAVIAPVVPVWLDRPSSFFHRMADSFSLYDPVTGFHPGVLARAAGEPMRNTLAMFCSALSPERGADLAGQGTLYVPVGPVQGALLLAGLLLTLADGWGTAVLPVVWFTVMLLGCGAFAQTTPWYTRLVPATAVAALLMARALDGLVGLVPATGPWRRLAAAATAAALLFSVTLPNVRRYVRLEEGRPQSIYTLFRLEADQLPTGTRFVCVTFERPDFTCGHSSFGPFVARPFTEDVADPLDVLPIPPGQRTAFLVPFERFVPHSRDPQLLVEEILHFHPDARVLRTGTLPDNSERPLGTVVVVERGSAARISTEGRSNPGTSIAYSR